MKIGKMKISKKILYIMGGTIGVILIAVLLIILTEKKEEIPDDGERPSDNIVDIAPINKDLEQEEYLENNGIVISDINVTNSNQKYVLSFLIENKSSKKIDLTKYTIHVLNKQKHILTTIGGSALGIIEAKETRNSIIELSDNIYSVDSLKFIKNK